MNTTLPASTALPPERDGSTQLPDGRTLTYGLLGAGSGPLVFVLDGPGSRGLARAAAEAATSQGIRLVAPDRPGSGGSTPKKDRTIAGFSADLLALADHLEAPRFGLVGQSGGTPFALAAAAAASERVTGLALVGGISPLGEPHALDDVKGPMKVSFVIGKRAPWLLKPLVSVPARQVRKDPEGAARRFAKDAPEPDRKALEEPVNWAIHVRATQEVMAHPDGLVQELRLLTRDWGIDLSAIGAPVELWVGELDPTHPPSMSRRLAQRLNDAPVHVVPNASTFSITHVFPDVLRFAATGGG